MEGVENRMENVKGSEKSNGRDLKVLPYKKYILKPD